MKLDSIVYETSTLASALSEQLQMESPTFKAIYPSETATSMVNVLAGYGSMLQYMVVSSIANCYTDSAFSPSGIYQLAETLGNRLHGNIAASVTCELSRPENSNLSSIIIPSGSIFTVEEKNFFNPSPISFGIGIPTVKNVLLVQGTQTTYEKLTSGVEDEKIYFGSDFQVDPNYLHVYVNDVEWDVVDSFIAYDKYSVLNIQEMQSVVVRTDSDGRCYVKFGNGINGLVPDSGSKVTISYVVNDGENGNILKNNLEVSLVTPIYYNDTEKTQLIISADKTSTAYGGANTQDLMTLKESSPYVFASGERCIRRNDYTAVLLNKCGYKTCSVWGEFEQAKLKGAYDKSMMNMVYYTGLKSFRYVAPYDIGTLSYSTMTNDKNPLFADGGIYHWQGSLQTSRALPGSVRITIENIHEPDTKIIFTDTGGHGILFNNDEIQFDTDDLLPDFVDGIASLAVIGETAEGSDYNYNTIENIVYNLPNSNLNSYYESKKTPSREQPIQIALNYLVPGKARSLAGIKFYIPSGDSIYLANSIGSFAIYGTNSPYPSYDNVSNNSEWSQVVPFTPVTSSLLGEWTDWIASTLYETGEGANITVVSDDIAETGLIYYRDISRDSIQYSSYAWTTAKGDKTVYTAVMIPTPVDENIQAEGSIVYRQADLSDVTPVGRVQLYSNWPTFNHYVIEVYSLHNESIDTLKLGKIKLLYAETEKNGERVTEVSTIDYDKNGAINLNVSSASKFFSQFYTYDMMVNNLKPISKGGDCKEDGFETLHYTEDTLFYHYDANSIAVGGENYIVGDIVSIVNPQGAELLYKVTRVTNDGDVKGIVQDGEFLSEIGNKYFEPFVDPTAETPEYIEYTTTLKSRPASVLTVSLSPQSAQIALDSRCYIKTTGDIPSALYFRNSSYDMTLDEGDPVEQVKYLAWTTLSEAVTDRTIFTKERDDEELVVVGDILYAYDDSTTSMVAAVAGAVAFYQAPLPAPEGLKLTLDCTKIQYEYIVKIYGVLPEPITPDPDLPDQKVYYQTDIETKVSGTGKNDLTDYSGRFYVNIDPSQPAPEGRLLDEDGNQRQGTIKVTSTEALEVKASYYGNKLASDEIARIDSVILDKYNHFTTYVEYVEPKIVSTHIKARVNYKDSINITEVKQNIQTAINELFELKPSSMGKVLYLSEIYNAIRDVEGVNYVLVDYPTSNIIISPDQLLVLSELDLIDVI